MAFPGSAPAARVDVRRGADRFTTRLGWLRSRHSFSFGNHYNAADTHFGLLLANNDDVVLPGTGYDEHPHRDVEIVTWVVEGSLAHRDSTGHSGVVHPLLVQRMTAGTGIRHSERNDAWLLTGNDEHAAPVRFVQMWVAPDRPSLAPSCQAEAVDPASLDAGLVCLASGLGRHRAEAAVRISQRDAALHAARLAIGQEIVVPRAPFAHLYVVRGAVTLEGAADVLAAGDAARISAADGQRVVALEASEILLWEMHSSLDR